MGSEMCIRDSFYHLTIAILYLITGVEADTRFTETFSLELLSVFLATEAEGQAIDLSDQERDRLILDPDAANVTILDDDGMQLHLINVLYNMQTSFLVQWLLLGS